ncbi:MAG: HYR domain-containing protein [Acidobacteriia bacterium]|nr:HYR domain-containing protein [Terriglobia bacterium]
MLLSATVAQARITKIVINTASSQSPTFGNFSWPGVGQYEKIVGTAFGELDPTDPKNSVITDIGLAPTTGGKVQYSFSFYILKPIDLSKGAHKVMYEPPNRGGKTWSTFGRFPGGNDPGSVTDPTILANAFLMPRGYTMVWSGWDFAAGSNTANFNSIINLPLAHNPDGSTITGPAFEYIVTTGTSFNLSYPAADPTDKTTAVLTHRVHLDDPPIPVSNMVWSYNATGTAITVPGGFVANDIYEFSYTAKDPTVNGIGFAAIRDFNAFLRYETKDDAGTANPLAGDIQHIYTEVVSQPGRLLNDFRHLGFNQAENGKQVFDAMMQWIAAGDGINMNYRWSQPGRTERNRQDHLFAEGVFPFSNVTTTDPISHQRDSRLTRCRETHTCPEAAEIYSANEYWVKAASLFHTTPDGTRDLPDSKYSRLYFISSHQHGTGNSANKGACQQFQNPLNSAPIQRALWIDLDEKVTHGIPMPPTEVPRLWNGTLQPPLPQSGMGFPHIPGVTYTGLKTTRYRFDYGTSYYDNGIPTINPPHITPPYEDNPLNGPIYPSFIPKTDSDGNDIAGVRLPDVAVPLATYTGWALRAGAQANDGCESSGQFIPFPKAEADRVAKSDPRSSVAERYPTYGSYYTKVGHAIDHLVRRRLMLPEDVNSELTRLVNLGQTLGVPANRPPVAVCADVTVKAKACATSARASINNGSSDPDGDKLTLTQSPPGPYGVGKTPVTLTVADPYGGSNSCQATVTVVESKGKDHCDGDHDGDDHDGGHDGDHHGGRK